MRPTIIVPKLLESNAYKVVLEHKKNIRGRYEIRF